MTSAAITTSPGTRNAFFRQNFLVGRTRGVIIGTLHEIDMRPRGHPRCDERAFGVEVNPATRVRIGFAACRRGKAVGKNRKSKKERAFSVRPLRQRPRVFHRETPAVSCILIGASAGRQGWSIQQQAFSINRIDGLKTGPGLGEL